MTEQQQQPDAELGDWDRFDHLDSVALGYVHQWCLAVQMEADRLLSRRGGVPRWVDASFLVMALSNARRAAVFAAAVSTGGTVTVINEAVDQFDQAVPEATAARGMVEHFDDYERGTGDTQQPGTQRSRRNPDRQRSATFTVEFVGHDSNVLKVGPHQIDMERAAAGALLLQAKVHQALQQRPTGN